MNFGRADYNSSITTNLEVKQYLDYLGEQILSYLRSIDNYEPTNIKLKVFIENEIGNILWGKNLKEFPKDEPVFLIRGKDKNGFGIVFDYARKLEEKFMSLRKTDFSICNKAVEQSYKMREWAFSKGKEPDL